MNDTVKIRVSKEVELQPIEVPDTIFEHPEVPGLNGVNLPLDKLGQGAADALIEDFITRFYKQANLKSFWQKKVLR